MQTSEIIGQFAGFARSLCGELTVQTPSIEKHEAEICVSTLSLLIFIYCFLKYKKVFVVSV